MSNQSFRRIVALILACLLLGTTTFAAPASDLDPQLRQQAEKSLKRAAAWLLAQQADDGLWHSATYGQMRGGAGDSALALYSLTGAWPLLSPAEQAQVRRGLEALLENLDPTGFVRAPDGSSDYPNYATALTLHAIERAKLTQFADQANQLRRYLTAVQHPDGGWGQTGGDPADLASTRQPNISVTRYVLEALQASPPEDRKPFARGAKFVSRLQHDDPKLPDHGSFHFTFPADDPLNKAGWQETDGTLRARGYASATADGVLALLAAGIPPGDPRIQVALRYLEKHDDLQTIAGIPAGDPEVAANRQAFLFYYYAALAEVIQQSPTTQLKSRSAPLIEQILSQQKPDGSWSNPSNLMREDDPLIATPLALEALSTIVPLPNGK
jgi:hypothetical protein